MAYVTSDSQDQLTVLTDPEFFGGWGWGGSVKSCSKSKLFHFQGTFWINQQPPQLKNFFIPCLSYCILNELPNNIYWKSLIPILGMSGYVIYKYRYSKRKLAKLFANNGDWSDAAFCAIWSGSALFANYHFKESPDYNGLNHLMCMHNIWLFMIIWKKNWCVCFLKSQSTDKLNGHNMKDSYLLKKNVENCIKNFILSKVTVIFVSFRILSNVKWS